MTDGKLITSSSPQWTVLLGSNTIVSDVVLEIEGVEVFRLRERSGDGQLVADFDVRDAQDRRIVKVAKNNVVHADPGIAVRHGPSFSDAVDEATGKVLARAEEVSPYTIRLEGDFTINGCHVLITNKVLIANGNTISGNFIRQPNGKAIVLSKKDLALGVRR